MSQFSLIKETENIFLTNFSEIEGRFDAIFYKEKPDISQCVRLSKFARVSGGKRLPKGSYYSSQETGYRYLRVGDISWDGTLNYDNFKNISPELFETLKYYRINKNEILLAIVGATIGKCSILKPPYSDKIILTENCAKIKIFSNEILPDFLLAVLKTDFVQHQIQLNYIQTTLPKLGLDRVLSLYIPTPPIISVQNRCLDLIKNSFIEKQQKEQQAKDLLETIDKYLLDKLGIKLPEKDTSLENRVFKTNLSNISGGRFDSVHSNTYFKRIETSIENGKYKTVNIGQILTKISRPFNPQVGKEYSYIQLGSIGRNSSEVIKPLKIAIPEIPSRAKQVVQENDILFSNANPQWGVHIMVTLKEDGYIASSGFNIYQSNGCNSFYTELLRSSIYKELYEKYLVGAGLFLNISDNHLMSIKIPLPPLETQNEIAEHITNIRQKAKQLEQEAETILKQAKQEVEKIILGK